MKKRRMKSFLGGAPPRANPFRRPISCVVTPRSNLLELLECVVHLPTFSDTAKIISQKGWPSHFRESSRVHVVCWRPFLGWRGASSCNRLFAVFHRFRQSFSFTNKTGVSISTTASAAVCVCCGEEKFYGKIKRIEKVVCGKGKPGRKKWGCKQWNKGGKKGLCLVVATRLYL